MPTRTHEEAIRYSTPRFVLPLLRLLVLIGLITLTYLLYLAMTNGAAAGCAEGQAGCDEILKSRWSKLFGIPVAGLALAAYVILLFASVHAGEQATSNQQAKAWSIMALVAIASVANALWFIGVQVSEFDSLCPYCMLVHGCSIVIAALCIWQTRSWLPWVGVLPALGLVVAQLLSPSTPNNLPDNLQSTDVGDLALDTGPVLGDPKAPIQIVMLYDYNCRYCRSVHGGIKQALNQYDGKLSILMLPTALDPACNHAVKKHNANSVTSCELARLALAVWIAGPSKFAQFDQRIVQTVNAEDPGGLLASDTVTILRAEAAALVGETKLESALQDPRLEQQKNLAASLYASAVDPATGHRGLPRVVISGKAYAGILSSAMLLELIGQRHPRQGQAGTEGRE